MLTCKANGKFREKLSEISGAWMANACGLESAYIDFTTSRLANLKVPIVEFAHTPQIPHIGIVRQFLVAQRLARQLDGILVYAVNDHLPSAELPESRYLPLKVADRIVPRSPQFGPGKKHGKSGMAWLKPPCADVMDSFFQRWCELQPEGRERIDGIAEASKAAAHQCSSFAAWLTRITIDLLQLQLVAVPTTEFAAMACQPVEAIKTHPNSGWAHCSSCGYRMGRWPIAGDMYCRKCAGSVSNYLPDVVLRQMVMNLAQLEYRVCGQHKAYQDEADQATRRHFGVKPPQRVKITGKTVIRSETSGVIINRMNVLQLVALIGTVDTWPPPPLNEHEDWTLWIP